VNLPKATRTVRLSNPEGLHLRAATVIAEVARRYRSKVALHKGSQRAEATEVLQIATLGAAQGEEVVLEASGDDAEAVLDTLVDLFHGGFGHEEDEK